MRLPGCNTRFRGTPYLVFLLALTFLHPGTLKAQFTSVLEGRITDPSDAPIPNAEVTVEHAGTGLKRVVRTSDLGYYRFASLPPGTFSVKITAQGFDTGVNDGVLLEGDQTKTFNIQLKVGARRRRSRLPARSPSWRQARLKSRAISSRSRFRSCRWSGATS